MLLQYKSLDIFENNETLNTFLLDFEIHPFLEEKRSEVALCLTVNFSILIIFEVSIRVNNILYTQKIKPHNRFQIALSGDKVESIFI